jgi:hypothetical protein
VRAIKLNLKKRAREQTENCHIPKIHVFSAYSYAGFSEYTTDECRTTYAEGNG